jgi:tetratricopeptide (TPR) repeat protein
MPWHPLVAALLFGMFHGCVLFLHTAIAVPEAPTMAAQKFMAQGWSAWQRGAFEEAVRAWLAAAQRYEQAQQPRAQSVALTQLARAYQALGQYRKAVQNLSSALELAQKAGDRAQEATVLGGLGGYYFVTGSLDAAQQALQEGVRLAREISDEALIAALLNDLGNVFTSQSRYAEALDAYGESV